MRRKELKETQFRANRYILSSKRLKIIPSSPDMMKDRIQNEQDEGMKAAYQEMLSGMEQNPDHWLWYTYWIVQLKKEKKEIGGICFKGSANQFGEVEIEYGIDEAYQHQGYGSEAVQTVINWAYTVQKPYVYFVMAETAPDNEKSQRLLKKLSFHQTGRSGEEGPLFELERPATTYLSSFMCLGISIGLCIGMTFFDSIATGMVIGEGVAVAIGLILDHNDKMKRVKLKENRQQQIDLNVNN